MTALDAEIASQACSSTPERFSRYLRQLAAKVKDPAEGASIAERQKAASRLDLRRRSDGMWDIDGRLDPERAKVANDLLRQQASKIAGNRNITPNDMAAALYDLLTNTGGGASGTGNGSDVSRTDVSGARAGDTADWPPPRMGIGYIVDAATLFCDCGTPSQGNTGGSPGTGSQRSKPRRVADPGKATTSTPPSYNDSPAKRTSTPSCSTNWTSRQRSGEPDGQQLGNSGSNSGRSMTNAHSTGPHRSPDARSTTSTSSSKTAAIRRSTTSCPSHRNGIT